MASPNPEKVPIGEEDAVVLVDRAFVNMSHYTRQQVYAARFFEECRAIYDSVSDQDETAATHIFIEHSERLIKEAREHEDKKDFAMAGLVWLMAQVTSTLVRKELAKDLLRPCNPMTFEWSDRWKGIIETKGMPMNPALAKANGPSPRPNISSRFIREVDGKITEQHKYVLSNHHSEAAKEFRGCDKARQGRVQIEHEGKVYPAANKWLPTGMSGRFLVAGGDISKHIKLIFAIESGKPIPDRESIVEISIGKSAKSFLSKRPRRLEGLTGLKVVSEVPDHPGKDDNVDASQQGYFRILVEFHRAVLFGVDNPETHWDEATLACLTVLKDIFRKEEAGRVYLRIRWRDEEHKEVLARLFQEIKHGAPPSWAPYLAKTGTPMTQFGQMKTREELLSFAFSLSKGKFYEMIEFPAKQYFSTLLEARIKLTYSEFLEWEHESDQYAKLAQFKHQVNFVILPSALVIACIHLVESSIFEGRSDENVELKVTFYPENECEGEGITISGQLVDNYLGFAGHLFLIVNRRADRMKPWATELREGVVHKPLLWECDVKASLQDNLVKDSIAAVNQVCEPEPEFELLANQWIPVLMNTYGANSETDTFETAQHSTDDMAGIVEEVLAKKPFSDEQRAAVRGCLKMTNRNLIIDSPGGTGKTTVIGGIVDIALKAGFHVLATAPAHGTVNNLYDAIASFQDETYPEDLVPVRGHRIGDEKAHVTSQPGHDEKFEKEWLTDDRQAEAMALDIYNEIKLMKELHTAPKLKRTVRLDKSIAQLVITKAMGRVETFLRKYPRDPDVVADLVDDAHEELNEDLVDMYEELRGYLKLMEETHISEWEKEDKRKFGHCFKLLTREVVRGSKCIVTTTGNVNSHLFRHSWARDLDTKGVLIIIDESEEVKESMYWATIFKSPFREFIEGVVQVGDNKQGTGNKMRSRGSLVNEFAPQGEMTVFARLIAAGFKHHKLTVQHRMHPVLAAPINRLRYEGVLQDGPTTSQRTVPGDLCQFLLEYLGINMTDIPGYFVETKDRSDLEAQDDIESTCRSSSTGIPDAVVSEDGNDPFKPEVKDDETTEPCDVKLPSATGSSASSVADDQSSLYYDLSDPRDIALPSDTGSTASGVNDDWGKKDEPEKVYPICVQDAVRLHLINVIDGAVIKDKHGSRYNQNSKEAIWLLIEQIKELQLFPMEQIVVLTPYRFSLREHRRRKLDMAKKFSCDISELPEIRTVSSYYGCSAKMVLLDLVIVAGEKNADIGFMLDEGLATVAFTRALDYMFVFANTAIVKSNYFSKWKPEKNNHRGYPVANPKPLVVSYIENLIVSNKCVDKSGGLVMNFDTIPGMDLNKKDDNDWNANQDTNASDVVNTAGGKAWEGAAATEDPVTAEGFTADIDHFSGIESNAVVANEDFQAEQADVGQGAW